jgi:hypothetical protein
LNLAQDLGTDPTPLTDKRSTAMAKYRLAQRADAAATPATHGK